MPANRFDFGGTWTIANEYAQASAGSTITESFSANHVYMILKPHAPGASDRVLISLDGKPLSGATAGADVKNGLITVDSDRLYEIYSSSQYAQGVLGFTFQDAGTQAFTFTFG